MTDTAKRAKASTLPSSDFDFEDALKRLEKIVEELERGDLKLETSITLYEEGVTLSQRLSKRLEQAQRRVDVLMKSASGELTLQPFHDDQSATDKPST